MDKIGNKIKTLKHRVFKAKNLLARVGRVSIEETCQSTFTLSTRGNLDAAAAIFSGVKLFLQKTGLADVISIRLVEDTICGNCSYSFIFSNDFLWDLRLKYGADFTLQFASYCGEHVEGKAFAIEDDDFNFGTIYFDESLDDSVRYYESGYNPYADAISLALSESDLDWASKLDALLNE